MSGVKERISPLCYAPLAFAALLPALAEAAESGDATRTTIPVIARDLEPKDYPELQHKLSKIPTWECFGGYMRAGDMDEEYWQQIRIPGMDRSSPENLPQVIDMDQLFKEARNWEKALTPAVIAEAIRGKPGATWLILPGRGVGKPNRVYEDSRNPFRTHRGLYPDLPDIIKAHPQLNIVDPGGCVGEADSTFNNYHYDWYGRIADPHSVLYEVREFFEGYAQAGGGTQTLSFEFNGGLYQFAPQDTLLTGLKTQVFYRGDLGIPLAFSLIRGSGRQYGLPHTVQFSGVLWPFKDRKAPDSIMIPVHKGSSFALARQVFYLSWLTGARAFRYEQGPMFKATREPAPLGYFLKRADHFLAGFGPPGPMQTPIAIMQEFTSTWKAPAKKGNRGEIQYEVYNGNYAPEDHQLFRVMDLFFPGCHNVGGFDDERYALCATPYGDGLDVIYSDAKPEFLNRYALVIVAGRPVVSPRLVRERLRTYADQGGRVVLFTSNVRALYPEWVEDSTRIPPKSAIDWTPPFAKAPDSEECDFDLLKLRALPPGGETLAQVAGHPLVVRFPQGRGEIVLILSQGINATPLQREGAALAQTENHNRGNQPITSYPHLLSLHARAVLDHFSRQTELFSVSNEALHYVVTRKAERQYVVGIFNDNVHDHPFTIVSRIGPIAKLTEVTPKDSQEIRSIPMAYMPSSFFNRTTDRRADDPTNPQQITMGKSGPNAMEGRDVRLFLVELAAEDGVRVVDTRLPGRPKDQALAIPQLFQVRKQVQRWPSFFDHFDSIKIDGRDLLRMDPAWMQRERLWVDRRELGIVVDAVTSEAGSFSALQERLKAFTRAPVTMVVRNEDLTKARDMFTGMRIIADDTAIRLRNPTDLPRWMAAKAGALRVLDRFYEREDDFLADLQTATTGKGNQTLHGTEATALPATAPAAPTAKPKAEGPLLLVAELARSPSEFLAQHGDRLKTCSGVAIDAALVLGTEAQILRAELEPFLAKGIPVVVDFRGEIDRLNGFTWYEFSHYEDGLRLFSSLLERMSQVGLKHVALNFQGVKSEKEGKDKEGQETPGKTLARMLQDAKRRAIALHVDLGELAKYLSALPAFPGPDVQLRIMPGEEKLQTKGYQASPFSFAAEVKP